MNFNGLKSSEVEVSRTTYGSNKLPEPELEKWYHFAKEALTEPITMILIIIALFQLVLGAMGVMSLSEPIMIIVVLAIVTEIAIKTGLGIQKSAAELRAKTAVRYCDVVRDGSIQTINKDDLVVGDLVLLRTGQEIFADGFIVEGEISVNNAAINGETKECRKIPSANYKHVKTTSTAAYTDQCSLFAGTVIMSGEGKMIVTDVGVNTVNGDTLVKMQTLEPPKTALDIALDHLCDFISKWGTIAAALAFVIMTITGILNAGGLSQYFSGSILESIQKVAQNVSNALTIIVAAVPEGLPLIVKLVTKQNVSTMEKFNILAKNTGKIPELAYVNLICTDKTGTLTTGEMTSTVMINGNCQDIFNKESSLNELINLNICMNNSAVFDSNGNITGGNSIDRAVLDMLSPEDAQKIQNKAIIKKRVPFSSENKFSAITLSNGANDFTVYKGAPEKLIEKCKFYLDNDGIVTELTEEKRKALKSHIKGLTEKAMRCIALTISDKADDGLPDEMNFLGVIGVVDPVRNEVPEAVKIAHKAGIQVIEITGDCMETAKAVAMEAGIYKPGDLAVTNDEFEAMSDVKVKEIIPQLRVISRCSPNTKLRLVTLAQEIGMSVAMTGDGVNDAPALKQADIGFAMGDGTAVAQEAGDVVILNNSLTSIKDCVLNSRTMAKSVGKFLIFQLTVNISTLLMNIIAPILGWTEPFSIVQILWINLIMDTLAAMAFGGEPILDRYMKDQPAKRTDNILTPYIKSAIGVSAIFITLGSILILENIGGITSWVIPAGCADPELYEKTFMFAFFIYAIIFNSLNTRSEKFNLFEHIGENKNFVLVMGAIFVLQTIIIEIGGKVFNTTLLEPKALLVSMVLAVLIIPVDLIRKAIMSR